MNRMEHGAFTLSRVLYLTPLNLMLFTGVLGLIKGTFVAIIDCESVPHFPDEIKMRGNEYSLRQRQG